MKKTLALIIALIMMSALMLTSATAATYKVIQGNLLENGDFNSDSVDQYFWINPDDGIYRGGTCVPQKTGGVGNSGWKSFVFC